MPPNPFKWCHSLFTYRSHSHSNHHNINKIIHHGQVGFILEMQIWFNIHKSINTTYHINKLKDKNDMIISLGTEKAFDKIQHLFMKDRLEIEEPYLNI